MEKKPSYTATDRTSTTSGTHATAAGSTSAAAGKAEEERKPYYARLASR